MPGRNDERQWDALKEDLNGRSVVSYREFAEIVARYVGVDPHYASRRLRKEGVIRHATHPARGLYLVGQTGSQTLRNPFEAIQAKESSDAAFAYGTALFLHGVSRYGRLSDYYVLAKDRPAQRRLAQVRVHYIKSPLAASLGIEEIKLGDRPTLVTDRERTIIDCIHRPKYAQGWENVLHAVPRFGKLDEQKLRHYLTRYRLPSLVSKLGVIIERFRGDLDISNETLDRLQAYLPRNPVSLERGLGGRLNKRWRIYIPDDFIPR